MWGFPELASGWGPTSRGLTNCYRITITGSWGRLLVYTTTYMDQTVRHDITAIMLKVSLNTITHLKRDYNVYIVCCCAVEISML
jgi:hypothetical protein